MSAVSSSLGVRSGHVLKVAAIAAIVAVLGYEVLRLAPGYLEYDDGVAAVEHHELMPSTIDPAWVLSGSPQFRSITFENSSNPSSISGIWECTGPGKFRWEYGVDEVIYVLEGSAEIEYLGKKFTLKAGDSTKFVARTSAVWTVPNYIKKTYRMHNPGKLTKLIRFILPFPLDGGA